MLAFCLRWSLLHCGRSLSAVVQPVSRYRCVHAGMHPHKVVCMLACRSKPLPTERIAVTLSVVTEAKETASVEPSASSIVVEAHSRYVGRCCMGCSLLVTLCVHAVSAGMHITQHWLPSSQVHCRGDMSCFANVAFDTRSNVRTVALRPLL